PFALLFTSLNKKMNLTPFRLPFSPAFSPAFPLLFACVTGCTNPRGWKDSFAIAYRRPLNDPRGPTNDSEGDDPGITRIDLIEDYPMAPEPTSRPANQIATPFTGKPRSRLDRPLAIAAAVVFLISSAFPVVAGFVKDRDTWPKWWGVLDVGIAF